MMIKTKRGEAKSVSEYDKTTGLFYCPQWLKKESHKVFICEGEADTAAIISATGGKDIPIIGTPGTNPSNVSMEGLAKLCSNKHVYLLPQSGPAAMAWMQLIGKYLLGCNSKVSFIPADVKTADVDERLRNEKDKAAALIRWYKNAIPFVPMAEEPTEQRPAQPIYSDIYNGEQFVADYAGRATFCPEHNCWYLWDGKTWQRDIKCIETIELAKATTKRMMLEAESVEEEFRKIAKAHAKSSATSGKLEAMLFCARSEKGMSRSASKFDQHDYLLTVANGTIDLERGELLPHNPDHLMTKQAKIKFDRDAKCPRWIQFLEEIFAGDTDLIRYMQRLVGYSLTGSVKEQGLWVFWGSGCNGKSLFTNVLHDLLGDYYHRCDPELFVEGRARSAGQASPHIVALKGARVAIASETKAGAKLAETALKELTGGDQLTGRQLHAEPQQFYPSHKLILLTNHRPRVTQDPALWRRLRLVPFSVSFEGREDRELGRKLRQELEGILAWAVEGCLEWQRDGLRTPDKVKTATEEYKREEDVLGQFLEDRCTADPTNQFDRVSTDELFNGFVGWMKSNQYRDMYTQKRFTGELEARGYQRFKTKGRMFWNGIRLNYSENEYDSSSGYQREPQTDAFEVQNAHSEGGWSHENF